jgi:hypothetical protein
MRYHFTLVKLLPSLTLSPHNSQKWVLSYQDLVSVGGLHLHISLLCHHDRIQIMAGSAGMSIYYIHIRKSHRLVLISSLYRPFSYYIRLSSWPPKCQQ